MTTVRTRTYGWHPDLPGRDPLYAASHEQLQNLPPAVDLRTIKKMPPIRDQQALGSCTAFAVTGVLQIDELNQQQPAIVDPFEPSELFVYFNERRMQHSIPIDSGSSIRAGIRSVSTTGYCPESLWPYNTLLFTQTPPDACYQSAKVHKALKSQRIMHGDLMHMKACLAFLGLPFLFGFSVYSSFESQEVASTGIVPLPQAGETLLGGHAVSCVGYRDDKQWFIVKNSWSATWGDQGYCYMPYSYLLGGLASDFWVIQTVQ